MNKRNLGKKPNTTPQEKLEGGNPKNRTKHEYDKIGKWGLSAFG